MASDLWNIFLNIIAAFIYAAIVWAWGNRHSFKKSMGSPPVRESEAPPRVRSSVVDRRLANRQVADHAAYKFIFYLCTFAALYLSITTAPLFKALFTQGDVLLSHARFIGEYLPDLPIGKSHLQMTFFLMAAIVYFPLLFVSQTLASLLAPLVDAFTEVSARILTVMTMLVFLVFCIPIAAASTWLFFEKTFLESLFMTMFFLAMPFVLSQAQAGRR